MKWTQKAGSTRFLLLPALSQITHNKPEINANTPRRNFLYPSVLQQKIESNFLFQNKGQNQRFALFHSTLRAFSYTRTLAYAIFLCLCFTLI